MTLAARTNDQFEAEMVGVTVVIPHYGSAAMTAELVRQLQKQRSRRTIEIIVSDDDSPEPFPPTDAVTVIRSPTNGGFGAAVNRGVAKANQPLLLVLNSDVTIHDTFLDELVAADPFVSSSLCGVRLNEPDGNVCGPRLFPRHLHYFVDWIGILARWRRTERWKRLTGDDTIALDAPWQKVDWVTGAVMLVPLKAYRAVGGMDEQFHMYMEEVDLQRRLREVGIPTVFLNTVGVEHAKSASSSIPHQRIRALMNARLLYDLKWSGWVSVRRLQLLLSLASLIDLIGDSVRQLRGVPVHALLQFRERLHVVWQRPTPHFRSIQ